MTDRPHLERGARLALAYLIVALIIACGARGADDPEPIESADPGVSPAQSGPEPAPTEASSASICDNRASLGVCQAYPADSEYLRVLGDMAESICGAAGGTWSASGACPSADRIGRCRGGQGETSHYYTTGARPFTAEHAERACESAPDSVFVPEG